MDGSNVVLEFARFRDAPTLARMSRDLIETGLGWSYRTERIRRLIADPEATTVVATEEDRPVGFAIMTFGEVRGHLVLLAVTPSHRRHGIGRRLVQWLLKTAAVAGMESVHVEMRAGNGAAQRLYRALDFIETARVPGYYHGRESALKMMRLLRAAPALPGPDADR